MEPKWKFWNQNGTKIGFWEPTFDFWNQNGTKIGFLEPKWNQNLDFWNQNGTKILKYTEFLSKKRSHEFTPNWTQVAKAGRGGARAPLGFSIPPYGHVYFVYWSK